MSYGSVSGAVYVNDRLLVSQVVSSSETIVGGGGSQDVEYVELFNPTTFPVNIGSGAAAVTKLNYKGQTVPDDVTTGAPAIIASSTGIPKPSRKLG